MEKRLRVLTTSWMGPLVFAALMFVLSSPGRAAADDCGLLGGISNPGECTISTAVSGKSGTFFITGNLHITGTGSISVALPPPFPRTITINIDGSLIMDTGAKRLTRERT